MDTTKLCLKNLQKIIQNYVHHVSLNWTTLTAWKALFLFNLVDFRFHVPCSGSHSKISSKYTPLFPPDYSNVSKESSSFLRWISCILFTCHNHFIIQRCTSQTFPYCWKFSTVHPFLVSNTMSEKLCACEVDGSIFCASSHQENLNIRIYIETRFSI